MLERRIFRIDIRQTAHLSGSTLITIIIINYISETIGMKKLVMTSGRTVKSGR